MKVHWIILGLLAAGIAAGQEAKREYHATTIAQLTTEDPANWKHPLTHIEIEGFVTYVKREGDGDLHIRVCDSATLKTMDTKRCIVAECIPELPCAVPKKGAHVIVQGIGRYDAENPGHHWWEAHPAESLKILP